MKKLFDEIPRLENEYVTLRRVTEEDAEALRAMTRSREVYRYLPTFLFEQQNDDIHAVIREIYGDIFRKKQSLILAVCRTEAPEIFCGLAEFYGFRHFMYKTCIGYRLAEQFWGQGIAAQTVCLRTGGTRNRSKRTSGSAKTGRNGKAGGFTPAL